MTRLFDQALDTCLSIPADAVLIECGGDLLGANVPLFLKRLKRRRARPKVVFAAADAVGAWGGTQMLRKMGLTGGPHHRPLYRHADARKAHTDAVPHAGHEHGRRTELALAPKEQKASGALSRAARLPFLDRDRRFD